MKPKPYRPYREQVALLRERGMHVPDEGAAVRELRLVNYYRLSGYWYAFRESSDGARSDRFREGTELDDVLALYRFDERLRMTVFDALVPVELALRAALGHALGRLDPCAHLRPDLLGPLARTGDDHRSWLVRHRGEIARSREEFVEHHRAAHGGVLPVWAAVEVMDWGTLSRLFGFAPPNVQAEVSGRFGLRAPQLTSWLRALNVVRNACAHHGRLFNRAYAIRPRLPSVGTDRSLDTARASMNRTYGQLTLVQYLRVRSGIGSANALTDVMRTFPRVQLVPFADTGAPTGWETPVWTAGGAR